MNPYVPQNPGDTVPMTDEPPKAVTWARLYAGAFTVMYVLCVIGGVAMLAVGLSSGSRKAGEAIVQGAVMAVVGLPLAVLSGIATVGAGRRSKGMYTLHLVLQGLGCTSCCCLPLAVPVLIQWLKPEVKTWYGA